MKTIVLKATFFVLLTGVWGLLQAQQPTSSSLPFTDIQFKLLYDKTGDSIYYYPQERHGCWLATFHARRFNGFDGQLNLYRAVHDSMSNDSYTLFYTVASGGELVKVHTWRRLEQTYLFRGRREHVLDVVASFRGRYAYAKDTLFFYKERGKGQRDTVLAMARSYEFVERAY